MDRPLVVIFHQPPANDDPPLTRLLQEARDELVGRQSRLFEAAGARLRIVPGREAGARLRIVPGREAGAAPDSFGARLASLANGVGGKSGIVVLGSGAVALLGRRDARQLVEVAARGERVALTNNRYSSDVCAVGDARVLRRLPPLPSDNALPRWLEEVAGMAVAELPGRDRLGLDLDTPLDLALIALARAPRSLRRVAEANGIEVPRLDELRRLAADPRRELLIFGRAGSRTLRWLERHVRCRVRFLAEERGLRASSALAIGDAGGSAVPSAARPARATLGRLLATRGPGAIAESVAELADGAVVDSRVLLADRFGVEESRWPAAEDRFASDLLRADQVEDPWLRELTESAAGARVPILMGAHTVVGPGIRVLLGGAASRR